MEKPCNTCYKRVCNMSCCDSYLMYKQEEMTMKQIISEAEYDRLADQTQCHYWYCARCKQYILRAYSNKCVCGEG